MPDAIFAAAALLLFQYGRFVNKANDASLLCVSDDLSRSRFLKFRWQYRSDTGAIYVKISQPREGSNPNATGVVTQQRGSICRTVGFVAGGPICWTVGFVVSSLPVLLTIPFDGLRPASVWDRHRVFASIDIKCDVLMASDARWDLPYHQFNSGQWWSDRPNRFYAVIADCQNTSERSRVRTDYHVDGEM